jgi:hypothetical protein
VGEGDACPNGIFSFSLIYYFPPCFHTILSYSGISRYANEASPIVIVKKRKSDKGGRKLGEKEGPGGDAADGEEINNRLGATADTAIHIV